MFIARVHLFRFAFPIVPALALIVLPFRVSAQAYPGFEGEPPHMDVSCLCNSNVPPPGEYLLMNNVAYSGGAVVSTGDTYPTMIEVAQCGEVLELDVQGGRSVTLESENRGGVEVYRGSFRSDDGFEGTMTFVDVESDGLPFEPSVRFLLRGEAGAAGIRFPMALQLQSPAPQAFEACECALMARYYERIAQYRESFADRSLIDDAERRGLTVSEFQRYVGEERTRRREAFDRTLGRTEADEIEQGRAYTTQSGVIHVDDLDLLERGVPPKMIESVHVHERVHQRHRQNGEPADTIEAFAREEVLASDEQLEFLETWLRANCEDWQPPTQVFR